MVTRLVLVSWKTSVMGEPLQHSLFFPSIRMRYKYDELEVVNPLGS